MADADGTEQDANFDRSADLLPGPVSRVARA
jgi:hypothetical protein